MILGLLTCAAQDAGSKMAAQSSKNVPCTHLATGLAQAVLIYRPCMMKWFFILANFWKTSFCLQRKHMGFFNQANLIFLMKVMLLNGINK
jgi:hypothetical protein